MRLSARLVRHAIVGGALVVTTPAQAQTAIPGAPGQSPTVRNDSAGGTFKLLDGGLTSIGPMLLQQMNCIGGAKTR